MSSIKFEVLLYKILSAIWRKKKLIIIPVIMFSLLGLVLGFFVIAKYETRTTILIQEPAKINPFLQDLSIDINLKQRFNALNSLLHSNHILGEVLEDLDMINEDTSKHDAEKAIQKLSESLTMSLSGGELVTITYRTNDRTNMDKILEAVSGRLINRVLAPAISSINKSTDFLSRELERSHNNLIIAEQKVAKYKSNHSEELPILYERNVERLSKLQSTLAEKRSLYKGHKSALESLQNKIRQTNPVIGKLEEQIISLSSQLNLLTARYTDEHSKVQAVQRKLDRLQEQREILLEQYKKTPLEWDNEQLWNMATVFVNDKRNHPLLIGQLEQIEKAQAKVVSLKTEIENLEEVESQLRNKVNNFGDIERDLLKLEREVNAQSGIYESILERTKMAEITKELGEFEFPSHVAVIDKPYIPANPITLPVAVFVLIGMVGGLIIGGGLATLVEMADTTVRYPMQLAEITELPVLYHIPALQQDMVTIGDLHSEILELQEV